MFLRNKDIKNKCKVDIYKIYFKGILLHRAETWITAAKNEDSKTKFLIGILGQKYEKTKLETE